MNSTVEQASVSREQSSNVVYNAKLILHGNSINVENFADIYSPYGNKLIGKAEIANNEHIEYAIQKATEGFKIISSFSPRKRAEILENSTELILQRTEELAKLISLEIGKPIKQAIQEIKRTVEILELTAEETLRVNGEITNLTRQEGNSNRFTITSYHPLGPILAITPFNFPAGTIAHKVGSAIAAGNSIILKPSPSAQLITYNLAKILLEAGLPEECLCLVNCSNSDAEKIVKDKRIKLINFTGSSKVGWNIRSLAHPGTKVILEMGGNSPVIIHEDANLNKALTNCIRGSFAYSGQYCISTQRIYLHSNVFDEFLRDFTEATKDLTLGDPLDADTDIGPMINEASTQRISSWVDEAIANGARLLTGGKILENNLYSPTVITEVNSKMNISCSEVFGPIVSFFKYDSIEKAIEEANDEVYGLSSGIFTQNIDLALNTAKELNTGSIMINDSSAFRSDEGPICGLNQSASGLEGPKYAIKEMSNLKVTCFNVG
ncbi:MAG: aldehyde dehydrogenase family protein [Candidatus Caenarcaniphilales bacterium]|nr:aldehyde dehydrogenase family protein [Candidatus Caenarcaniphilales bacterium]